MLHDRKILWQVLIINAGFFGVEIITGFISNSMGLVADSLDMLADAFVYGLSLYAVSGDINQKRRIARISGYLQLVLALAGFIEVTRRTIYHAETPDYKIMILVSLFALAGNVICLSLLQKSKNREAHIQASKIFTANDVLINTGVIVAGGLVYFTSSRIPDLMIGTVVFILIIKGTIKIFRIK